MKKIFVTLFVLVLGACTFSFPSTTVKRLASEPREVDYSASFYIAIGSDGQERTAFGGQDMFEGSGRAASLTILNFLKDRGYKASLATQVETEKEALATAHMQNYSYMIYPKVVHWNDSVYMMCGRGSGGVVMFSPDGRDKTAIASYDHADVDLMIYDVALKKVADSYNLNSYGCPVVFINLIPLGTNTPEARLEDAMKAWMAEYRQ